MKTQQLCKDFLRMRKGTEVEAMQASQLMNQHWGILVDWHEMSDALEYLVRSWEARREGTGPDGLTMYFLGG